MRYPPVVGLSMASSEPDVPVSEHPAVQRRLQDAVQKPQTPARNRAAPRLTPPAQPASGTQPVRGHICHRSVNNCSTASRSKLKASGFEPATTQFKYGSMTMYPPYEQRAGSGIVTLRWTLARGQVTQPILTTTVGSG